MTNQRYFRGRSKVGRCPHRDYPGVFLDELPGILLERDVEFTIDLFPDIAPISKAPYRMAPSKMLKLKSQLRAH